MSVFAWRSRRRPQEEQEADFRKEFDAPQWGPPKDQLDIGLTYYRFPLDRMKEIGAECGYDFVEKYLGKYEAGVRFKRRSES